MSLVTQVSRQAQLLYPGTGYHTWDHVLHVYERGVAISNRLRRHGVKVDLTVVKLSILLHDVLSDLSPSMYFVCDSGRFRTSLHPEEISLTIARLILERLNAPRSIIEAVPLTILGTHPDTRLETIEQMVVAAADLDIACPYDQFFSQSELLRREAALKSGASQISPAGFYRGSINYLARYLMRRIQLTQEYFTAEGQSAFHVGAVSNIAKLARRTWKHGRIIGEVGCGKTPLILSEGYRLLADDLFLRIDLNPRDPLTPTFSHVQADYKARGQIAPMTLFVPGEERALSVPSETLDQLYLNNCWLRILERPSPLPLTELRRVLRPGAELTVVETYQSEGSMLDARRQPTLQRDLIQRFESLGLLEPQTTKLTNGWAMSFSRR